MSMFSDRLKSLIKENHLHYKDIEAKTGIMHYTINAYANGKVEPDIDSLILLCKYFNVSSDYLVGLSNQKLPNTAMRKIDEINGILNDHIISFKNTINKLLIQNKTHS